MVIDKLIADLKAKKYTEEQGIDAEMHNYNRGLDSAIIMIKNRRPALLAGMGAPTGEVGELLAVVEGRVLGDDPAPIAREQFNDIRTAVAALQMRESEARGLIDRHLAKLERLHLRYTKSRNEAESGTSKHVGMAACVVMLSGLIHMLDENFKKICPAVRARAMGEGDQ